MSRHVNIFFFATGFSSRLLGNMKGERPPGLINRLARDWRARVLGATLGAAAIAESCDVDQDGSVPYRRVDGPGGDASTSAKIELSQETKINPIFDNKPEFFVRHERGSFSRKERKERTEILANGEKIFHDIGLDFYYVKRGDTISGIRQKLGRYPKYAFLADQTKKLESFNIPANKLRSGMLIPIPMENEDRHLTDEQFVSYTQKAIEEMETDEVYGKVVGKILKKVSVRELQLAMIATAKQESGGLPLGRFELHRWEAHQQAFSFSLFHVLMKGPGIKARRNLDLTEGQLYHPQNAVKLFLAFIIEKCKETGRDPASLFPIVDNLDTFTPFYNGSNWRNTNPNYKTNITKFYKEAEGKF